MKATMNKTTKFHNPTSTGVEKCRQFEIGYRDGHKSGWADAGLGYKSDYSSISFCTEPAYTLGYKEGYCKGHAARLAEEAKRQTCPECFIADGHDLGCGLGPEVQP